MSFALLAPLVYGAFQMFDTTPVKIVLDATGRNMTLTDRNLIWADVINDAAKSPVLGVGFGAFWVGPIGYEMYPMPNWSRKTPEWRPEEAHNGFVDVYVQLGAVGEMLLLIVIGVAFSGALTHLESDFQFGSLRLTLLLSVIISNMTETSFLDGTHGLWFLFLLAAINLPSVGRGDSRKGAASIKETCSSSVDTSSMNMFFRHPNLCTSPTIQLVCSESSVIRSA
jgi:O-antigen ligase